MCLNWGHFPSPFQVLCGLFYSRDVCLFHTILIAQQTSSCSSDIFIFILPFSISMSYLLYFLGDILNFISYSVKIFLKFCFYIFNFQESLFVLFNEYNTFSFIFEANLYSFFDVFPLLTQLLLNFFFLWLLGFLSGWWLGPTNKRSMKERKSGGSCKPLITSLGSHTASLLLHSFCYEANAYKMEGKSDFVSPWKNQPSLENIICHTYIICLSLSYHLVKCVLIICFFVSVSSLLSSKHFENKNGVFIIFKYSDIGSGLSPSWVRQTTTHPPMVTV